MLKRNDLTPGEFNSFYSGYINLVNPDKTLLEVLEIDKAETVGFFLDIPEKKLRSAYAPDKWTILEVLLHIIDTERIFNYRALCIARGDQTAFPGFDQDDYVDYSNANDRSLNSLLKEYAAIREASLNLFGNLDEQSLQRIGKASGNNLSARAAGFIISGHENHHKIIIQNRYL